MTCKYACKTFNNSNKALNYMYTVQHTQLSKHALLETQREKKRELVDRLVK